MRYTLRQLEYFVAVAETGRLSEAAARCKVSQSGVALAVSELERALGVQLVVRRRAKGVTLTPSGHQLLADARALLSQAEDFQATAQATGGRLSGRLRVGCYTTLAPFYIPPLLDAFAAEHPQLRLEFVEDAQAALQGLLLQGALDVALLYDRDLDPGIEHRLVRTLQPYVLLAGDHRLAGQDRVSLGELAGEPVIRLDLPPIMHGPGHLPDESTVRHRTANLELVRCLVGRGLGYSVLVQRPPTGLTYEGRRVVALPIADAGPDVSIVLAHPRGVQLTRRAEALADFCPTITH